MVMEKSDGCSSIAMLQERFRQLEKVKEMREERELLNLISSSTPSSSNHHLSHNSTYNDHHLFITSKPTSNNLFFHSEIIFPTYNHTIDQPLFDSQLLSLSLSLWPTSHNNKHHDTTSFWGINIQNTITQNLTKNRPSWLTDVVPLAPPSLIKTSLSETHVIPDVDTTLHL